MAALLYFGLKFAAYTAWCYLGLHKFRPQSKPPIAGAVAYGFLRLFLGFFFGVLIWLLSSSLMSQLGYGFSQNVVTYVLVYVPVRWVEWTIMAMIIVPGSHAFSRWAVEISHLFHAGEHPDIAILAQDACTGFVNVQKATAA